MAIETLAWREEGLEIIDQRLLPLEEKRILCTTVEETARAIETLAVRGAPAIGVAAAYGVVVAALESCKIEYVRSSIERLARTRPTAVNLFHALDAMSAVLADAFDASDPVKCLLERAREFHEEDIRICRRLSENGAGLLKDGATVLTHCNAGGLATSGYGTALGVIYAAKEQGKKISVYADETRPLLQGARLTAWELMKNDIPVTVICDNMAAVVMARKSIDCVIVGADRIAGNGDTANKIGTYGLSIIAKEHAVPFYIAAPMTTFDFTIHSGNDIPIEERDPSEVSSPYGTRTTPYGVSIYNPSFDVTPAGNITAIITEKGVAVQPLSQTLEAWCID